MNRSLGEVLLGIAKIAAAPGAAWTGAIGGGQFTPAALEAPVQFAAPAPASPRMPAPPAPFSPLSASTGKKGGSLAWRNNNPGNIRYGDFAASHGALGAGAKGFAAFNSPEEGRRAGLDLLRSKRYRDLALSDAISRWAPPSENDTASYISGVGKRTGLNMGRRVSELSQSELEQFFDKGITAQEGWIPG